jgi:beta-fructofuranosidase
MLITARSNRGAQFSRGVVGHAWSADLDEWEVRPPLSEPGGFGQLEVMQLVLPGVVDSMPRLLFACGVKELDIEMHPDGQPGGMWIASGAGMLGPWDIANARRIDHPSLYAAHIVTDVDGSPAALGFDSGNDDEFGGFILDPVPLRQ